VSSLNDTLVWDFFSFNWCGQKSPIKLLINHLKYFLFWFCIRHNIHKKGTFMYSEKMYSFSPCRRWIRKFLFHVFSKVGTIYCEYSANTQFESVQKLRMSAYLFWESPQFHPYLAVVGQKDSFQVYGEGAKNIPYLKINYFLQQLLKRHYLKR
jgi:hypothetical protein